MNAIFGGFRRVVLGAAVCATAALIAICAALISATPISAEAQTKSYERTFPQSKTEIEKAIARMQSALSGRLPVLDGFADPSAQALDRYRRGFYQAQVQVASTANGGSVVRVTAKVTAWYNDPAGAHSGYQLLPSNGRIESDVLDQISDQMSGQIGDQLAAAPAKAGGETVAANAPPATSIIAPPVTAPSVTAPSGVPANKPVPATVNGPVAPAPVASAAVAPVNAHPKPTAASPSSSDTAISAPSPRFPETSTSISQGLASSLEHAGDKTFPAANSALQAELENLEEVLKNQAHPKNLVAVRKSGTPVVSTPSLTAKPEFLANQHDEFELLNFNADWVHVRVSGLSRGWIWRNSVEMPEGIPDTAAAPVAAMKPVEDLFRVTRDETAQFPGDWAPLRSKNVKILTVQRTDDAAASGATTPKTPNDNSADNAADNAAYNAKERLDYARFLLEKTYSEMAAKPQGLAGIVVIFDSADGGMIAASVDTLQQWKAGTLSDAALWHKCFFDPPELLDSATPGRGQ